MPAVALAAGRAVSRLTARRADVGLVVVGVMAVLAVVTVDQSVRVTPHAVPPAAPAAAPAPTPTPTPTPGR